MSLTTTSGEVVKLRAEIAKEFRDMKSVPGERELSEQRAKGIVVLLSRGRFFRPHWAKCELDGVWYRGNGNHTSNVATVCFQAEDGELDEKSKEFFDTYLGTRSKVWSGTIEDLPIVPSEAEVFVEEFHADTRHDLVEFFRCFDSLMSVRSTRDVLSVYARECDELNSIPVRVLESIFAGVVASAVVNPDLYEIKDPVMLKKSAADRGVLLRHPSIVNAVCWIWDNVSDSSLYKKAVGAQLLADVYMSDQESAEQIISELIRQIEEDEEPGTTFWAAYAKPRKKEGGAPSARYIYKKGMDAIRKIRKSLRSITAD